jgi:threonine/homoserine/homoserine lactone efflux protein
MDVDFTPLIAIFLALSFGAASPGPSFVMVARTAVAASRRDGLAAALGMGAGGVVFAFAALLGLHALLTAVPGLFIAFKIAGGAYIAYLGWRIWRGASTPLDITEGQPQAARPARSFALGFATQITNPKTAIVYAGIFAAMLPREIPTAHVVVLPLMVFIIEAGWYAFVALALSSPAPRAAYLRSKSLLDRLAGGIMAVFGIKLVISSI